MTTIAQTMTSPQPAIMQPDPTDAAKLLTAVWGETTGYFRRVFDDKPLAKLMGIPGARNMDGDFNSLLPELQTHNTMGYGIFFIPNPGGHCNAEITHSRCVFIDIDNGKLPKPGEWHVEPHLILQRGGNPKWHVYWLIETTMDLAARRRVQQQLATHYNSDRGVADAARAMRLPGFQHCKKGSDFSSYQITSDNSDTIPRYTLEQVANGLPDVPEEAKPKGQRGVDDFESDDEWSINHAIEYLEKADPAIEGDGGEPHTRRVIFELYESGLSQEKTLELMMNHWNDNCVPEWPEDELQGKIAGCYAGAQNAQGCNHPAKRFIGAVPVEPVAPPPAVPVEPMAPPPPATPFADGETLPKIVGDDEVGSAHAYFSHRLKDGAVCRYDSKSKTWWRFNGQLWKEATTGEIESDLAYCAHRHATSITANKIRNIRAQVEYAAIQSGLEPPIHHLPPSNLVFCQNGTLNIDTGELRARHPDDLNRYSLPVQYDPTATAPRWDAYIDRLTHGDADYRECLQMFFGATVGGYPVQNMVFLTGRAGSGKGVFVGALEKLIGDVNCGATSLEGLTGRFGMEGLINSRLITLPDVRGTQRQWQRALPHLLQITGRDRVNVDRKGIQNLSVRLTGMVVLTSNELPSFYDSSTASDRRMIIFPFRRLPAAVDPQFEAKLEAELSGILNWALEGLELFKRNDYKLREPITALNEERAAWEEQKNPMLVFIKECCSETNGAFSYTKDIKSLYLAWAAADGKDGLNSGRAFEMAFGPSIEQVFGPNSRIKKRRGGPRRLNGYENLEVNFEAMPISPSQWPGVLPFPRG